MRIRNNVFPVFICLLFAGNLTAQNICIPTHLQCEHMISPLGIDATQPRLAWQLSDSRQGAFQSAYQILVGTDSLAISLAKANFWQTAKINGDAQLAYYKGKPLLPFTKYFWAVRVWDKNGLPSLSPIAHFETGMMQMQNWKGAWIHDTRDIHLQPAPYFRKAFEVQKKIVAARAYIAVAGLYELYINGERIGDHRLDPMYTRFDRRTLYVTYDVTAQLQTGKNAIGVLLGNGWYNHQSTAVWYFHEAPWRARPSFCMDLRITYSDGTQETIASGKDWKTTLSPVIFNSIYTAEHYDARKEIPHWNEPDFTDTAWQEVDYCAIPSPQIVAQVLQPIRNVEALAAAGMQKVNDSLYVFNLGRNIAGVSSITVSGEAGTILRLKHGERLYTNGLVDISNIDAHYRPTDDTDPFQTDIYILKGGGKETFMPHFNYKGFQYVELSSSKPIAITKENLTGYFMHSDVEPVGNIHSDNNTINKIWSATNYSYLSNLFGYPTDCPQREKNGWTGDGQIAVETGLYNFDGITIYEKWMADHRDEQQPNGVLPSIVPTGGWGYEWANGPDWTSTIAIIPWNLYMFYGDSKALLDCYDNIKHYVDYINYHYPTGLTTWGLGDWIPVKSQAPVELTSTAYYYADATILANAAKLFNKTNDYLKYSALAVNIKTAFNEKYLNKNTGIYGTGLQTELCVPLFWGLVPEEMKSKVAANLASRIIADSVKLDVGLLGTKAILNALSENGYADLAYQLAANETYPSWGWWIKNGATTLYENWPIDAKSDISMNHIMFGEIGAWMYKALGGIKPDAAAPGFKHILLQPYFAKGLNQFSASHQGPFGNITSAWQRKGSGIDYTITIPPNSNATVKLVVPAGQSLFKNGVQQTITGNSFTQLVNAGTYQFQIK
ncbi:alpha-L-rhamnosidase [Limnovirga soli]|uniref:alpha-L-rhamnosidase n=1 Tax=Limnovirga soli TaxID=2656915 RepID=A0A8J8FEA2_9BACT|nr:alpha-L-rhamnosidase [Limnovirga soli]NNV56125.1 Bacterial alpha-L-rhamnosidase [Limnovirga soli]